MLLFLAYLLKTGIGSNSIYYLEYLTVWGLISLVVYTMWSTATVTYTFIYILVLNKPPHKSSYTISNTRLAIPDTGCCCCTGTFDVDSTSWYHKVLWILFTISTETAFGITVLFWTVIYPNLGLTIGDNDIIIHLMNGVLAYLDLWITGIPVRIYHFYIACIFGCIYSAFSGIHYVTLVIPNTTSSIYPVLDYGSDPATAVAFATLGPLILFPLIHLIFFGSHLLRRKIIFLIRRNCKILKERDEMMFPLPEEDLEEYPSPEDRLM